MIRAVKQLPRNTELVQNKPSYDGEHLKPDQQLLDEERKIHALIQQLQDSEVYSIQEGHSGESDEASNNQDSDSAMHNIQSLSESSHRQQTSSPRAKQERAPIGLLRKKITKKLASNHSTQTHVIISRRSFERLNVRNSSESH